MNLERGRGEGHRFEARWFEKADEMITHSIAPKANRATSPIACSSTVSTTEIRCIGTLHLNMAPQPNVYRYTRKPTAVVNCTIQPYSFFTWLSR